MFFSGFTTEFSPICTFTVIPGKSPRVKFLDIDYNSQSNLNSNKPILSLQEIENLYKSIKKIQFDIARYWNKNRYQPIDVEFKIVGEKRDLYIKQVRVYND